MARTQLPVEGQLAVEAEERRAARRESARKAALARSAARKAAQAANALAEAAAADDDALEEVVNSVGHMSITLGMLAYTLLPRVFTVLFIYFRTTPS